MPKALNLVGQTFGSLEVLEKSGHDKFGKVLWKCKCHECGNITDVPTRGLTSGDYKTCGCEKGNRKTKDMGLLGQHINSLTVVEYVGKSRWKCICDCGNETIKKAQDLKSGRAKTCGKCVSQVKDITGRKFGKLVAIRLHHIEDGRAFWEFKCDCGRTHIANGKDVRDGKIISCGNHSINFTGSKTENEIRDFVADLVRHGDDITGRKFGKLTVLRYVGDNQCECQCDCGNKELVYVSSQKLKSGHTKSCGCLRIETTKNMAQSIEHRPRRIDLTGQKFGKLTVLEYAYTKDKRAYWKCECECGSGKEVIAATKNLRNGTKQSCGCLHKEFLTRNTRENRNVEDYPQWFIEELVNAADKQKALDKNLTTLDIAEFICPKHGIYRQKVGDHISKGQRKCGCPQCGMEIRHTTSTAEIEIGSFVEDLGYAVAKDRTILDGKEIDIYIPDLKLGIEYNGSPFHATVNSAFSNDKPMGYHRDKFLLAKEKGIHLISIYDVDWENNREKISQYLSYIVLPQQKIYARKCDITKVDEKIACEFVDRWHLQGANKQVMKINYGLWNNNELVAVMSFGKPRLKKQDGNEYELHRYCVKDNLNILGGAEKLFKHFIKDYFPDKIISYSDNDYFLGGIYERLGFSNCGQCKPRYYWYLNGQEIKREKCMLKNLRVNYSELLQEAYDVGASNKEDYVMVSLGACKVYRSGNTKWEWGN